MSAATDAAAALNAALNALAPLPDLTPAGTTPSGVPMDAFQGPLPAVSLLPPVVAAPLSAPPQPSAPKSVGVLALGALALGVGVYIVWRRNKRPRGQ